MTGFLKSRVFRFERKTCGKMARGEGLLSSWDGSNICRNTGGSLFQKGGTAVAMERFVNFSDELIFINLSSPIIQ